MTAKAQQQLKKRLFYNIDMATLDEIYEFKYELTGAIDEIIDSIQGLRRIIDVSIPLGSINYPAIEMMDEQDTGELPF